SRIATELGVGRVEVSRAPWRAAAEDIVLVSVYAVPVFFLLGVSADVVSAVFDLASPGSLQMIGVSMLAGVFATTAAVAVGYYGAVATYRLRPRPDNPRHPLPTFGPRFLGAGSLLLAVGR